MAVLSAGLSQVVTLCDRRSDSGTWSLQVAARLEAGGPHIAIRERKVSIGSGAFLFGLYRLIGPILLGSGAARRKRCVHRAYGFESGGRTAVLMLSGPHKKPLLACIFWTPESAGHFLDAIPRITAVPPLLRFSLGDAQSFPCRLLSQLVYQSQCPQKGRLGLCSRREHPLQGARLVLKVHFPRIWTARPNEVG